MPVSAPSRDHTLPEDPVVVRGNFWAWVLYQLGYRIGWQFKMESTMIAGLVGYLSPAHSAAAWMGWFTTVSNLGRCLAPALMAPVVDRSPRKRNVLLVCWSATVLTWAGLAAFLWTPAAEQKAIALWVFLGVYTLFFALLGAGSVAQGALLGKIIEPGRRGRALGLSVALSGPINMVAILVVWGLVRYGWFPPPRSYALSFTLTVLCWLAAGLAVLRIRERPSPPSGREAGLRAHWREQRGLLRRSAGLRRLVVVNLALALSGGLIGFYTTFGRRMGAIDDTSIVMATLIQVVFQAASSSVFGRMADARGNRQAVCGLMWAEAAIPLVALLTAGWQRAPWVYLAVYALVGFRFPLFQLMVNYLLEIVPEEDHALALGLSQSLMVITIPAPLLFGLIAGSLGYGVVMGLISAVVAIAALAALGLEEPREGSGKWKVESGK